MTKIIRNNMDLLFGVLDGCIAIAISIIATRLHQNIRIIEYLPGIILTSIVVFALYYQVTNKYRKAAILNDYTKIKGNVGDDE